MYRRQVLSATNYLSITVKMCNVFLREARLSPYAVSTHTNSNAQMKRPKSAILPQRGRAKRSTDPPNWESMPRTVIGWADKTDWAVAEQRPKQRTRPVSAPTTRNRWVGQIVQFCKLRRIKLLDLLFCFFFCSFTPVICYVFIRSGICSLLPFFTYPLVHQPLLSSIPLLDESSMPRIETFPKHIIYNLPMKSKHKKTTD